jgi:hypothetical protein
MLSAFCPTSSMSVSLFALGIAFAPGSAGAALLNSSFEAGNLAGWGSSTAGFGSGSPAPGLCGTNGVVNGLPFISPAHGGHMAMVAQPAAEFYLQGLSPLPTHATVGGCAQSGPAPHSFPLFLAAHGLPFLPRGERITTLSQLWQKVSACVFRRS